MSEIIIIICQGLIVGHFFHAGRMPVNWRIIVGIIVLMTFSQLVGIHKGMVAQAMIDKCAVEGQ